MRAGDNDNDLHRHHNLYVANPSPKTVSKVTPAGAVSTFATGLTNPSALAFDAAGNLYVANYRNNTVAKITPAGVVSTFVSTGLSGPNAIAVDTAGNVYVANYTNSTISNTTSSHNLVDGVLLARATSAVELDTVTALHNKYPKRVLHAAC